MAGFTVPGLTLYLMHDSKDCDEVLRYTIRHKINIALDYVDEDPGAADTLEMLGGKAEVPALCAGDDYLYGPNKIIRYLGVRFPRVTDDKKQADV